MYFNANDSDLWLINFSGVNKKTIIFDANETGVLGDILKTEIQKNSLKALKRWNGSNFIKTNKEVVKNVFNCDTHSFIELQKIGFI